MANRRPGIFPGRRFALALVDGARAVCAAPASPRPMTAAGDRRPRRSTAAGGGTSQDRSRSADAADAILSDCPPYPKTDMDEHNASWPRARSSMPPARRDVVAGAPRCTCMQRLRSPSTTSRRDHGLQRRLAGARRELAADTGRPRARRATSPTPSDSPVVSDARARRSNTTGPGAAAATRTSPTRSAATTRSRSRSSRGRPSPSSASASPTTVPAGTDVSFSSTVSRQPRRRRRTTGASATTCRTPRPPTRQVAYPDAGNYTSPSR